MLILEPDNPYDSNAIQVWVGPDQIPETQLPELLPILEGYGIDADTFGTTPLWSLGHVNAKPRDNENWCAATLSPSLRSRGLSEIQAKLSFTLSGAPSATLTLDPV